MHAAAMRTHRVSPELRKFNVALNGTSLSFFEHRLGLALDHDSDSIEDAVGMIFWLCDGPMWYKISMLA